MIHPSPSFYVFPSEARALRSKAWMRQPGEWIFDNRSATKKGLALPVTVGAMGGQHRQGKQEQHILKFLCKLIAPKKIRLASLLFVRVGHTHDTIDQLLGILARCIARWTADALFRNARSTPWTSSSRGRAQQTWNFIGEITDFYRALPRKGGSSSMIQLPTMFSWSLGKAMRCL